MANKLGTLAVYLTANSNGLDRGLGKAGSTIKRFAGLAAGALGVVSLGALVKDSLNLWSIQDRNEKQLARTLASTGHAAGLNARQLKDYASELQGLTTTGDEEIIRMETMLATFTKVTGDEFKRSIKLALDMSEVLGTDGKSNITLLGKSLQDPLRGMRTLASAGVAFSNEQKAQIKALVEGGNLRKAQLIILTELEKRYGGAAAAAVDTPLGRMQQIKNTLGDAREAFGRLITETFTLNSGLKGVGGTLSEWVGEFNKNIPIIAYTIRSTWTDLYSGLRMIWAVITPIGETISDIFRVAFTNMYNLGAWLWDNAPKLFDNLGLVAAEFIKNVLVEFSTLGQTIARLWPKILKAGLTGDSIGIAKLIGEEIGKIGVSVLRKTSADVMGKLNIPKLQVADINGKDIWGRFTGIGAQWDKIERDRERTQAELRAGLERALAPQKDQKLPGQGEDQKNSTFSAGVMKMVTSAAMGSLEAYRARYNTGKNREAELLKNAQDQLTTQQGIKTALDKIAGSDSGFGFANIEGEPA